MNITVTGASGFIGNHLIQELLDAGHSIHALGRKRSAGLPQAVRFSEWPSTESEPPSEALASADAIVYLAGESVAQRWTSEVKQRIRGSRADGTRNLVNALAKQSRHPQVLVCASAIGYYGSRGDETLTETSAPGSGFLAQVVIDWEQAARQAEALGIRVVPLRFGVVLGKDGGALAKMLPPFRLGLGGRLASGQQWMSWVHVDDVIALIRFSLDNSAARGPMNATSPQPVRNAEFTEQLANALHRPAIFPVPKFALKILFGEMAEVILGSQRVLPKAAQSAGFQFQYPELRPALVRLLSK
ncbi:MAG TPA: TIGR01777 family oxidoreductase [Bryobacteraceae bacterium]|nr:TIGR01777 family oxidoreductase [Bryobacteraceae bacterium]